MALKQSDGWPRGILANHIWGLNGSPSDDKEKVNQTYPQLPILVISSLGSATYAQRCKRLGARGFLGKEDCVALLCQAIRRLRSGKMVYPQENTQDGMLWGDLTDRELIALRCLARGADVETISDALEISSSTAKLLCQYLQAKLGLSSSEELVGTEVSRRLYVVCVVILLWLSLSLISVSASMKFDQTVQLAPMVNLPQTREGLSSEARQLLSTRRVLRLGIDSAS